MPSSTALTNIFFLGLGFFIPFAHSSVHSFHASGPGPKPSVPSIHSLFSTAPGQQLTYPPLDVAGPRPRSQWIEAFERAKASGLIPSIPPSKIVDYVPVYPSSYHGTICNSGQGNCNITGTVNRAPSGMAGISFDDGPQPPSLELLQYLNSQSQKATHFLIGSRILSNVEVFKALDAASEHLAVHTYSHPMMTSLSNYDILGELGWTMQLIHDYSRLHVIPRYWRPPYGDLDQRVEAIAKHVFGLETILWQYDPRDWCLADSVPQGSACSKGNGPQSLADLDHELNSYVQSDKKNGLLILEHEQSRRAVAGFKYVYPLMKKYHWITKAIPDLLHAPWYQ